MDALTLVLVLGIIFGPALLGLIVPSEFPTLLAEVGLAMLFFRRG